MKKSIFIILILTPFFFDCTNVDNSDKLIRENWFISHNNYPLSRSQRNELNDMVTVNPDSVIKITTEILKEYPYSREILYIRMGAYFELQNYSKCKEDLIKIIITNSNPNEKYAYSGMLDYLNCKIITNGDCGDSIFLSNSEYTIITISDDYFNYNKEPDTTDYDFIIE